MALSASFGTLSDLLLGGIGVPTGGRDPPHDPPQVHSWAGDTIRVEIASYLQFTESANLAMSTASRDHATIPTGEPQSSPKRLREGGETNDDDADRPLTFALLQ